MARKPNVFPSYLRHSSGQARIRVDGRALRIMCAFMPSVPALALRPGCGIAWNSRARVASSASWRSGQQPVNP